jgi:hypothetical protein
MNSRGNNEFSTHIQANQHRWAPLLILLAGLGLTACDSVPTEQTPNTGDSNPVLSYTGPACGSTTSDPTTAADACNFKVEFWDKMASTQCDNCHDSATGNQSPFFLESTDVNVAYQQALGVVNRSDAGASTIISKINAGHNCGDPSACTALATIVEGYLNNWFNGGASTGGGASNEIVLEAPTIKDAGASKTLPSAPGTFASTVWPLLAANCSNCHREAAPIPQAPFFAETDGDAGTTDDIDAAYAAILTSQKINLDNPADSRLVVRLRQEFHNCWDPDSTGSTDCAASADAMEAAITAFADSVPLSAVDPSWVISKAMALHDGQIASGGARDDSSTIALYEFKAGTGSDTVYDTSGVEPTLNLNLYGTEDIDYSWVGGWGIEFKTANGKAQGTTAASKKLRDRIVASGEYSIEAWVVPANVAQGDANDPSRIISYSAGDMERNFTLGQAEYRYVALNRSSQSDANGEEALITDDMDEDLQASQQHVVLTYDPINGRKIYVNGVDVSTVGNDAGSTDPVTPGSLANWDDTFALIFGNEASNGSPWAGKLRLVAIHNRAMTPAQVTQNFDAGVGEKFFVLFSVSEQMGDPACIVDGVDQCFVYFVVSQFDNYSYLFDAPTFVSLNPAFTPSDTVLKGMRIGLNGKEPAVGQAYTHIDTTINSTDYDSSSGQQLSRIGTIIALEKGADSDEFFLTFEQLGSNSNVRTAEVCGVTKTCTTTPVDGDPASDIGLRSFEEIYASMAAMTGVDPYLAQFSAVKDTYYDDTLQKGVKQQMPTVENINGFLAAHQMAVAQLAIQFCDALVEDSTLRGNFFGSFSFDQNVATAFGSGDSSQKNQIVNALYDKMMGYPDAGSVTLSDMPTRAEVKAELIGPAATNANNLFDRLTASCPTGCDASRTRAVVKAMCTSTLGSAAMLLQ